MAKLTDKLFNRIIEGKFVADSGDELPKELPAVSGSDNGKALVVSGGKWVAGTISGGTKLYKHTLAYQGVSRGIYVISNDNTEITKSNYGAKIKNALQIFIVPAGQYFNATFIVGGSQSSTGYYDKDGWHTNTGWSDQEVSALSASIEIVDEITPL